MKNKKESAELSLKLSKFYKTYIWPDDPLSEWEKKSFKRALKFTEILISHNWIKDIISKKQDIKVLEVCGGAGIGGVALSN